VLVLRRPTSMRQDARDVARPGALEPRRQACAGIRVYVWAEHDHEKHPKRP
jgi:hypothetical protein